ncbi:arabinogalactan oligomer / maltooligosaccharide transport system substrate-binding protein [Paenibacillus sp. UNCCL117]|uniref:sugar ABC transporter substrate-binding protein n=1 Tax=unclassified Paenibacillus TaxID=185978 RepID=UPI0008801164|nr:MULTISPECIES: maltose ABC transporter substrate-binding protein [unclassified Paenibacillus]SDD05365.1 carbohydrate ABC transporter substrate-binding protein, CUT1 family [Paenibacillus sp. cl123]SFW31905.1 arabinogalactan oligomer / maltooligosaccharide transport system substrate-binding protein [Paenibacillus sp. UNCCL117]
MKKNKALSLVAALSMAFSIAACSQGTQTGGGSDPQPVETPSATKPGETQPSGADDKGIKPEPGAKLMIWEGAKERPYTEEIVKRFKEVYNVEVTIDEVGPPDQVGRLTNDGPAGIGADVVVMPHNHLGRAVAAGLLLPNDIFGETVKKENTESSIIAATSGDRLYAYPRSSETIALYYNKSLVKEAPKTFEDVIKAGKPLTDKSKNKYGLIFESGNFYVAYPFFAGGYVYGKNGTDKNDVGLNTDDAAAGMKVFAELKNAVLPINTGDVNADIQRSLFTSGDAAMSITGPWELGVYKEALGDKLGIAPIPAINGKPAVTFSGVQELAVNAYTKYPNAAKLFARFATSKESQLLLHKMIGSVPTNNEAQKDQQIKNDPLIAAFVEQSVHSVPMPSIPEMENVWNPVGAALSDIWNSGKDPKTSLDNAVKQIKDANNGKQ